MPVWLVAIATILGSALIADLPAKPRNVYDVLVFDGSAFTAGTIVGLSYHADGLSLGSDAPSSEIYPDHPRFGVAESALRQLATPSALRDLSVEIDLPVGARSTVEARGTVDGRWTEWREADDLEDLDGSTAIQLRVTLVAAVSGDSPRLRSATLRASPAPFRTLDGGVPSAPTARVWATRIGLVGKTTANGHVVQERDHFVALPSRRALSPRDRNDYSVRITYRGKTVDVPVWDIGPWNIKDDYWNTNREQFSELPRWTSQSEAAFFNGYNEGKDGMGRFITLPTSLDLADGTFWDDLGMTANDWVDVTFLWTDAPSPPNRATPRVIAKTPPGSVAKSTQLRSASYNAPKPAAQLYLPLVMADANGWSTSWTIQNPSGSGVTGTTQLYAADGTPTSSHSFSLGPFGSTTFTPLDPLLGVPWGFVGSAVLSASGPIAGVVNEDRAGSDRMAYEAFTDGAPAVVAPIIFKDYHGWSTGIQVQNLGSAPTRVDVEYLDEDGTVAATDAASIPAMASRTFYQPANAGLPAGFAGSARIQSDEQPLAVLVNEVRAGGSAMAYPGAGTGAERLDVPLLFKHYNGWDTGLQLFNLGEAPAAVQVTYQTSQQPVAESMTIASGTAATFYQPASSRLPDGYVGSATVVAQPGARLVGVVNEVRAGSGTAMNYVVGAPPSQFLTIPLVAKSLDGWDSGIQVRNTGSAAAQVAVSFYSEVGAALHRMSETIPPGAARTIYPPSIPQIPAGFRGSAIIQSMNGQPLTAIVNEVGTGQEAGAK